MADPISQLATSSPLLEAYKILLQISVRKWCENSQTLKRSHAESDSDNDSDQTFFLKFRGLESTEDSPITLLFRKTLSSLIKPKSVKKLTSNTLLVEVPKKTFSDFLLEQKYFYNFKIKVYLCNSLNLSKSVVRSPDLSLCTLGEIKTNLCKQDITDVQRIFIKKNNLTILTNTHILSFNTSNPPTKIKIGLKITKVEIYISNLLKCHNYQKFRHHKAKCTRPLVFKNCAEIRINHIV